jgi:S-adenosylmethionine uptake transporter
MPIHSQHRREPAQRTETTPPALPLLVAALAVISFVCMDAVIKVMTLRYDALQLTFFRFAGGSVFAVSLWAWQRGSLPRRDAWRPHLVRSLFLIASLVGYFHALTVLSFAQAVAISYLAPIFVAALALVILKERPSPSIWLALAFGLAGVVVSVLPELRAGASAMTATRLLGMASGALAALSFACVMLLARQQARSDSVWTILLLQTVLPMMLLAAPAAWTWRPLLRTDLTLILLAGGLGTLGLLGLTHALTRLEVSRVAPLEYSNFLWAAALGYWLFGEVPTPGTAASAALIVCGCLLLLRR